MYLQSDIFADCRCHDKGISMSNRKTTVGLVFDHEKSKMVADALNTLTDREKEVIMLRFWDKRTHRFIANEYDVCSQRACQIVKKALKRIGLYIKEHENE